MNIYVCPACEKGLHRYCDKSGAAEICRCTHGK